MASQFDKINAKIRDRQDRIFRGSFVQLTQMTFSNSPKRDGFFQASWMAGIGAPIDEVSSSPSRNPVGTVSAEIKNFKIGMSAYLTNAQPYALFLEFGGSDQAKFGIVRKYAAQWSQINEKVARSIK